MVGWEVSFSSSPGILLFYVMQAAHTSLHSHSIEFSLQNLRTNSLWGCLFWAFQSESSRVILVAAALLSQRSVRVCVWIMFYLFKLLSKILFARRMLFAKTKSKLNIKTTNKMRHWKPLLEYLMTFSPIPFPAVVKSCLPVNQLFLNHLKVMWFISLLQSLIQFNQLLPNTYYLCSVTLGNRNTRMLV